MSKEIIREEIVSLIISNRKKGIPYSDCILLLKESYQGILDSLIEECIREAKSTIKKEFEIEREFLIDIHTLRYEELYDKAININVSHLPFEFQEMALVTAHSNALDILVQKEKMLGLHSKNFKVQVNNYLQSKTSKQEKGFDFTSLPLRERIELLSLIELTQDKEEILQPIISQAVDQVQFVKESVKQIEAPIRQSKQTDIIAEKEKTERKPQGKSLIEIQSTIQQNIKKQLEEAIKNKKK